MANAAGFYGLTLRDFFTQAWTMTSGLDSETLVKAQLVTNAYTPNFDTDDFRNDLGANEPGASGTYAAGGSVLTTTAFTVASPAATQVKYATANPSWTSATLTARGLVGYHVTGGASSTDRLFWDSDFGADVSSTAGTYTVTCPTNGWWFVDYA